MPGKISFGHVEFFRSVNRRSIWRRCSEAEPTGKVYDDCVVEITDSRKSRFCSTPWSEIDVLGRIFLSHVNLLIGDRSHDEINLSTNCWQSSTLLATNS